MTDPTPLSPAAQAVLDAVEDDCIHPNDKHKLVAAALRAAADEVVPNPIRLPRNSYAVGAYDQQLMGRRKLLAIAAELECANG